MALMAPPALVVGATRQPLPFGLFSTFTFRPGAGRWESGVTFETLTCDPAEGIGAPDCDPEDVIGLPKDLDPNKGEDGEASPFTIYGHFACSPVGFTPQSAQQRALEHLEAREEGRAEKAFWTGDLGNEPALQSATTTALNGGTAVAPLVGLGLLEDWIAKNYGSQGVIHMTRALAPVYGNKLRVQGNVLRTILGTPVAAGGGYPGTGPTGQAPAAGHTWAFVTPAMFGYRSDVFTSSSRPGDLLDTGDNTLYAIAERNYLLGFDPCGVAAVLINTAL